MLLILGVVVSLLVIWLLLEEGPANVSGATTDKVIDGVVYDLGAQPVPGAEVRVEIWGGSWPDQDFFRTSQSTVTDTSGHYEVTINANYWDPHNTIWVFSSHGLYGGEVKVEADSQIYQTVEVTLGQTIPEFTNLIALVPVFISLALIIFRRVAKTQR